MTDRELLEMAAKAAGMMVVGRDNWPRENIGWFFNQVGDHPPALYDRANNLQMWAPLTDDGDALRLAVKLELRITVIGAGMCEVCCPDTRDFKPVFEHESDGDTYAVTRRAIVRAAAEIGKAASQGLSKEAMD